MGHGESQVESAHWPTLRARPAIATSSTRRVSAAVELARGRATLQRRAKQTVDAILDAAGRHLTAVGMPINLTVVAADADVSIGSLYQYFPTHAALVRGLAERRRTTWSGSGIHRTGPSDRVS
jgi:hypothetical protein